MTMFITGGTSSIGRVLVKTLSDRGQSMRVLLRPRSNRALLEYPGVSFADGDVTNADSVRRGMEGCESVTHMAAIVGHNLPEAEWWRVNRDGSRNVLQAAHNLGLGMVQVSSLSVLGFTEPGETADESRPIDTARHVNLYQKTKYAADEIARDFATRGLSVKIVYPGFGYGCSQATSHPSLQDQTLLRMAAGQPVAIMGSGRNSLCLSYYNDTVDGILKAHERGAVGEGYILGNDNLTFPQLWDVVARVLGKAPPKVRVPLPVLKFIATASRALTGSSVLPPDFFDMISYDWCFSHQKATTALGWAPRAFEDGLRQTWLDYQAQGWPHRN